MYMYVELRLKLYFNLCLTKHRNVMFRIRFIPVMFAEQLYFFFVLLFSSVNNLFPDCVLVLKFQRGFLHKSKHQLNFSK